MVRHRPIAHLIEEDREELDQELVNSDNKLQLFIKSFKRYLNKFQIFKVINLRYYLMIYIYI